MNSNPSNYLVFQYSILALPLAFAGLPLYIHAPDFYTRDLGLNIGVIGIILLLIRLFDAIQDPVIGYISDKHSKQRFTIMAGGVALLLLGMAAVFYGPQFGITTAIWFALSMIIATTGFSIVTINLNMIGGFWQTEAKQRTRIAAWREALSLVGLLIASVLPAVLLTRLPPTSAFQYLFWLFSIIMLVGFVMFTLFSRQLSNLNSLQISSTQTGLSFWPILTGINRYFFGVCFLSHLAAALPGVMVLFFIRDYLDSAHLSGLFLFLYFISGAALMPLWVKLASHLGKQQAWLISMLLAVTTFVWAFFLEPGDAIAYSIVCILSGMALGADLALPASILADRITQQKSQAEATQFFAMMAFIPKVSIAIASGLSFLLLDALGFVAGGINSPNVMQGLLMLYALLPCLIKFIAAVCLWRLHKHEGGIYAQSERSGSYGSHGIS